MSTERITADDIRDAMDMVADQPRESWRMNLPPAVHRWMETHRRPASTTPP